MNAELKLIIGKLEYIETTKISSFNGIRLVKLTKDINYIFKNLDTNQLFTITVPKGFITDFGTVPKFAQCIVNPKGNGKLAFIIHDWLCLTKIVSRSDADAILYKTMQYCNVDFNQRVIAYIGVRLYAIFIKRILDYNIIEKLKELESNTNISHLFNKKIRI